MIDRYYEKIGTLTCLKPVPLHLDYLMRIRYVRFRRRGNVTVSTPGKFSGIWVSLTSEAGYLDHPYTTISVLVLRLFRNCESHPHEANVASWSIFRTPPLFHY